jgi:hypothetical protein
MAAPARRPSRVRGLLLALLALLAFLAIAAISARHAAAAVPVRPDATTCSGAATAPSTCHASSVATIEHHAVSPVRHQLDRHHPLTPDPRAVTSCPAPVTLAELLDEAAQPSSPDGCARHGTRAPPPSGV